MLYPVTGWLAALVFLIRALGVSQRGTIVGWANLSSCRPPTRRPNARRVSKMRKKAAITSGIAAVALSGGLAFAVSGGGAASAAGTTASAAKAPSSATATKISRARAEQIALEAFPGGQLRRTEF